MSSSSAVRRMKERGTGWGKITPGSGKCISTGKENSRSTSRIRAATQKPNIRPMARIDKSAPEAAPPPVEDSRAEPRFRRSSYSVPRGRSCSPSDFTRALSDLRKNPTRVPLGPHQEKGNCSNFRGLSDKSGEKYDLERSVSKVLDRNGEIEEGLEQNSRENVKSKVMVLNNGGNEGKIESLSSISVKRSDLDNFIENSIVEKAALKTSGVEVEYGSGLRDSKTANKVSNFPGLSRENSVNKHPSKLREKLAFLEGKVKRIASDIKRTKEMLDMNNPESSKMMLSDIQEKISGIERAMNHVVRNDGDAKTGSAKNGEIEYMKDKKELVDIRNSVKGLNVEELEARLFPHHKLIRERTFSRTTSEGSEAHSIATEKGVLNLEEKVSSLDGNTIASEFLAYLSKKETKASAESSEVQEIEDSAISIVGTSSINMSNDKVAIDAMLMADEKLDDFDDQGRVPAMTFEEEIEDSCMFKSNEIGYKTSTGGWFVSEGESVLLAHDDGSCSFYDITNCEEKAEYKPPAGISPNLWQDCWLIRAPSADGCSGRYVVAASAGNSVGSGFCSWDFYSKNIRAFHFEEDSTNTRTALAPLSNNTMFRTNTLSMYTATENRQWWYKPCGPLIISTASAQRMVQIYDIRDGDQVMKWELQKPVLAMDYASPLQWKNREKVVIAEADSVSLFDVSSLSPQALLSVSSSGRKISALHVNNTDAELGGGVRQRMGSSEAEGNDGVFCTPDSINVLDFRHPSGIGLKIPKVGADVQSAFSCGDAVYIGCTNLRSMAKKQSNSQIQRLSLRKPNLFSTYTLPESNAHSHFSALTQVWGNSNFVMGVCGLGLFIFESLKDDGSQYLSMNYNNIQNAKEIIGPDDMYSPSFDYLASKVLLVSRDRPAKWRYLS
ncbi:KIN14B-interacting protein At4g14310-like [Primulina tabacum]|uniref:KIN14B-interacting protein At4g14310-like n=1 Tax=Primulina tabacum TaxID=48773 RepID=UPI003F5970B5